MWTKTHRQFYENVTPAIIWHLWKDIDNWPTWHSDLDYCKLEGEFKVGNHFILKPKSFAAVKILLTDVNENTSFTDCTKFFGAKMFDTHSMETKDNGVVLTNQLTVTGPLTWLWVKWVAQNIAHTMPNKMDALVTFAQQQGFEHA